MNKTKLIKGASIVTAITALFACTTFTGGNVNVNAETESAAVRGKITVSGAGATPPPAEALS